MNMLNETDAIGQKLDAKAAIAADFLLDAQRGWELMRRLFGSVQPMPAAMAVRVEQRMMAEVKATLQVQAVA